jgi:hypothetical protein
LPCLSLSFLSFALAVSLPSCHVAERDEPFQDRWAATAAAAAAESQPTTPEPDIAVDSAPAGAAPAAEGAKPETAAAPAPAPRPFIHGRHTCDGCLATPIVGARYHCLDLPDFDLCGSCHASYDGPNRFESLELGASKKT